MSIDLNALKTPGPTITALTKPFWDAAAEGRLKIQHCQNCGKAVSIRARSARIAGASVWSGKTRRAGAAQILFQGA
ncbi:zinc ribbon domain-containing protein [Mesorhizobium atlanticum]